MATNPRFGLIPLPISDLIKGVTDEMLVQSSTGHIFIKQADGTAVSKTVELEQRLLKLENMRRSTDAHLTLIGELLKESLVLPSGVTASIIVPEMSVRLSAPNTMTNVEITFDDKYCSFDHSSMESYILGMDFDGKVKVLSLKTIDSKGGIILPSELADNSNSTSGVRLTSIVSGNSDVKQVVPVMVCDFTNGPITIRSMTLNKMDTNLYNCIDHGSSVHLDYRYASSAHIVAQGGIVSGKGYTAAIDTECFKVYKEGVTHLGYLKIYLPNNIIRPGSYALQLVLRNNVARMLDIAFTPTGITNNFRVNTTTYTPGINGRVTVNLKFEWDVKYDSTKEVPYVLINCGNTDIALIESVHIVRMYPAKYSDNSLWTV